MSIAVALHAGAYVLFAADTLHYRKEGERIVPLSDQGPRPKIRHAPVGVVAGTGVAEMVERIGASGARDVSELHAAILAERERAWPPALDEHARDYTGILFSFMEGAASVSAGVYHPHFNATDLLPLEVGHVLPFMRDSSYDRYCEWLEASVRVAPGDSPRTAHLEHNAQLLRDLIQKYAQEPDRRSCSAECTLAVHLHTDERYFTGVLRPGDPIVWRARFNSAALLLRDGQEMAS